MTRSYFLAVLALFVVGLACSSTTEDRYDPVKAAAATAYQERAVMWQDFCAQESNCKQIHENLLVLAGEKFAAAQGLKAGQDGCSDVTVTLSDGSEETRHYIVIKDASDKWQVGEPIQIDTCLQTNQ
jgi:hypothetical protein